MYHKISSLMLNTGKSSTGHREIFVAQPDKITEKLAGKVFILLEVEGKRNDCKKMMEFLVDAIDNYYYQDEKIFIRDKIEGLELENIFEAFLTKLNKLLTEFLIDERIKINPELFNITIGLIYEDKLSFSSYGKNKAYLIFRKKDEYEIINVEASASDSIESIKSDDEEDSVNYKLFSSVVSGEIPTSSYFFFTNENLPEYLSTREMVLIITKLPPIVAAEQMKQSLAKVNSFAPFLAIIIKNTIGLTEKEQRDEIIESLSAHNSISSLKHTEDKTENMLSPAGVFNFSKFFNFFSKIKENIKSLSSSLSVKFKKKDKKVKQAVDSTLKSSQESQEKDKKPVIDIKTKIEVVRSNSLFTKFLNTIKNIVINIFSLSFWSNIFISPIKNFKKLPIIKKVLFFSFIALILILFFSISNTIKNNRLRIHQEYFDGVITELVPRYELIDSYLLYDNEEGAKIIIGKLTEAIDNLKAKTEEQEEVILKWQERINDKRAKIQRLAVIEDKERIFDLRDFNPSAEPRNIILNNNILYIADPVGKTIYTYDIENEVNSSLLINASGEISLDYPYIHRNNIYYYNVDKIITINKETGQYNELNIPGLDSNELSTFEIFSSEGPVEGNDLLYTLYSTSNSLYRYTPANTFNQYTQWLQDNTDLSLAIDMAITGPIWILKNNAEILRMFMGSLDTEFSFSSIDPPLNRASRLLADDTNLYVFDSDSLRLIVYNQNNGNLVSQYEFPDLKDVYDLSIDYENDTIYLLANTSVYSFILE